MTNSIILDIKMHGVPVGTLTHLQGDRTFFAFDDSYINNPQKPVLSMSFKDDFRELITDFRPYQTKLMPFFSNLLPEGELRQLLAKKAGVNAEREFFLLWALGQDLSGAVTATPASEDVWPQSFLSQVPDSPDNDEALNNMLRFSLAGVQLKFSAMRNGDKGLSIPANGMGGQWIVKLPSPMFEHVPENEFSMMQIAKDIGMDVPDIGLVDVEAISNLPGIIESKGNKAFVIRRFDRQDDGTRVHIEDFAQVFDVYPHDKYDKANMANLARVVAGEAGLDDIKELIRRITFNVLIGNGDMHLKNWSLIYPDGIHARLAPAYDFVSTLPYTRDDSFALNFSKNKRFDAFTVEELDHLSAKAALPAKMVRDAAKDTVARFMDVWAREKAHLPMDDKVRTAIDAHLGRLPIVAT